MKGFFAALCSLLLACVLSVTVLAQGTAQISGVVRDQSGAVLPGVEVSATQTATGILRTTITNETGSYILPSLVVGPYRLEAGLPGFRTFVRTGVVLQVGSDAVVNPVLEIGQVTEQVEVQANLAQVETRSTAVGQVIENERILELPLNGRQATDLITLSGAAVQSASVGSNGFRGGVRIAIAGGQTFGVGYSLDGSMHNNPFDGTQLPLPFPDALQEFRVEASGLSASSGMKSGGAVKAVTKSGTNAFHGNAFEFVRNGKFNARNYFALQRDSLKRNQFGGTLGGPILENKLFFFSGYQGTTTRSDPGDIIRFVPTAAMLAGDWTTFASPACNAGRQIALRAPFVNNRIDPAQYSRPAMNIVAKLPKVQDPCGSITYGLVAKINEHQAVGKIDYQWTDKHSIFGRYIATTYTQGAPYSYSDNILATTDVGWDNLGQTFTLGSTYLISPNTVNAFRVTTNRTASYRSYKAHFSPADVGVNAWSSLKDASQIQITGGFNIGNAGADGRSRTTSYQIADDLNFVRGNHQMAFGGDIAHWRTNHSTHRRSLGQYMFDGTALGLGMADFFLGRLTVLNHGSQDGWSSRQSHVAGYAQDVWKATSRLTLNYGVRWEPSLPLFLTEGSVYGFDPDRFRQGIRSTVLNNSPAGLYFTGDPGFPEKGAVNSRWGQFAPRVGLAWDVQGNGQTSVRVSYGYAYDFGSSEYLATTANSLPKSFSTFVRNPAGGFEDPYRDFPGGNPLPFFFNKSNPLFPARAAYHAPERYDMKLPTVQSWNVSIQREVAANVLVSASYLGSSTTHLWANRSLNNAVFFPGNFDSSGTCRTSGYVLTGGAPNTACSTTGNVSRRRKFSLENPVLGEAYEIVAHYADGGTSNYHGLLFSVQRNAARGLNIGGNYTWSHCISDLVNLGGIGNSIYYTDPNNRANDRGNCGSDRRHLFNLTAVADAPQFTNPTLRTLVTGWRLSGIYRVSSGGFLSVTTRDIALTGNNDTQRPSQVLGSPYGDRNSLTRYLNPAAFAQPAAGTLGNMRPSSIEGPGFWQLDMALTRSFSLTESQRMEFRAEAFNLTNSFLRGDPATNFNANTFGQINTSRDARILQFALKYFF